MNLYVWKESLALALREWCDKNYPSRIELARILDIGVDVWKRIITGETIAMNVSVYAKIYLWTGLSEADPRTIPTREKITPTGKVAKEFIGWTDQKYSDWLNSIEGRELLERKSERNDIEIGASGILALTSQNFSGIGTLITALLNALQPYIEGSPNQRDQLIMNYGQRLAYLAALTEILTKPKTEREASLRIFIGGGK